MPRALARAYRALIALLSLSAPPHMKTRVSRETFAAPGGGMRGGKHPWVYSVTVLRSHHIGVGSVTAGVTPPARHERMSLLVAAVGAVLASLLETSVLPELHLPIDLVLVFAVTSAMMLSIEEGLTWAFLGGITLDLLVAGTRPLGLTALCLLLTVGGAIVIARLTQPPAYSSSWSACSRSPTSTTGSLASRSRQPRASPSTASRSRRSRSARF